MAWRSGGGILPFLEVSKRCVVVALGDMVFNGKQLDSMILGVSSNLNGSSILLSVVIFTESMLLKFSASLLKVCISPTLINVYVLDVVQCMD